MTPLAALAERPAMADRYDEATEAQPVTEAAEIQPMIVKEPVHEEVMVEEVVVKQVTGDVLELQPGDSIIINPLDFPRRGMSMDKVQNELGRPVEISPSVGEPPITRRIYADRVVFFEYANVIHVVERR